MIPANVSLEQLMLIYGCLEADSVCLAQIAEELGVQLVISGSVERKGGSRSPYQMRVFLFEARSERIASPAPKELSWSRAKKKSVLLKTAQGYVSQFAALLEAESKGTGAKSKKGVPELHFEKSKTKQTKLWPGVTLLSNSVAFLGLATWSWVAIRKVADDPDFIQARQNAGPTVPDVCNSSDPGFPFGVNNLSSLCSKADRHEKLQWVFLSVSLASAGVGTWLLVKHLKQDKREHARLQVAPWMAREGGGMQAHLRF